MTRPKDAQFSDLMLALMAERGMDQADLVRDADVATSTLTRWLSKNLQDEQRTAPKSKRVLMKLLHALDARQPLSTFQKARYASLANIPIDAVDPSGAWSRVVGQLRPVAAALRDLQSKIDAFDEQYRQPIVRILDLVDQVGEERTLAFLKLASVAAGVQTDGDDSVDVKHPPNEVDLDGVRAVEQVTATYTKPSRVAARGSVSHGKENEGRKRSG